MDLLRASGDKRIKFLILAGANQLGKSVWMAYDIGSFIQCRHPFVKTPRNAIAWISVTDFKKFEEVIMPRLRDVLKPGTYRVNKNEWFIEITSGPGKGNQIFLKSQEQEVKGYEGAVIHRLAFDEEHEEEIFQAGIVRTLKSGGQVLVSATLFKGLTWFYDVFIQPALRGERPDVLLRTGSTYDNQSMAPESIAEIERQIRIKDPAMADIRIRGMFVNLGGTSPFAGDALQYWLDDPSIQHDCEIAV